MFLQLAKAVYNTSMLSRQLVEQIFFFGLLGAAAILVWKLVAPFVGALALAAIIVTICYPLYERILRVIPRHNKSFASLMAVFTVILIVVIPLTILGTFLLREAVSVYSLVNSTSQVALTDSIGKIEVLGQQYIPGFSLNLKDYVEQVATFVATHLVSIFAGTASTIFLFFIALIASFYFFRDGKEFTKYLVEVSPLKDGQDRVILKRLAVAVRSVAMGTVLVALIQGVLTGVGLSFFGFDRAILWGSIAAIGALIPGVGTMIVFIPSVVYLVFTGQPLLASGVALWGALAVGFIDNLLGPYLMSRGNPLHPFVILISVLGGIAFFGPIGFILGPVILSLFVVLIELYAEQLKS